MACSEPLLLALQRDVAEIDPRPVAGPVHEPAADERVEHPNDLERPHVRKVLVELRHGRRMSSALECGQYHDLTVGEPPPTADLAQVEILLSGASATPLATTPATSRFPVFAAPAARSGPAWGRTRGANRLRAWRSPSTPYCTGYGLSVSLPVL